MKATKLEVGKTYRFRDCTLKATQVLGPTHEGWWVLLDERGCSARFPPDDMPEEVEPPAPWIVRTEYREPQDCDWFISDLTGRPVWQDGPWDGTGQRVVLIIEPSPEAQA